MISALIAIVVWIRFLIWAATYTVPEEDWYNPETLRSERP